MIMSTFTAPTWDVGKSATLLCEKFAEDGKKLSKKRQKKKRDVQRNHQKCPQKKKFPEPISGSRSNQTKVEQENPNFRVRFKKKKKYDVQSYRSDRNFNGKPNRNPKNVYQPVEKVAKKSSEVHQNSRTHLIKKKKATFGSQESNKRDNTSSAILSHFKGKKNTHKNSQFINSQQGMFTNKKKKYNVNSDIENGLQQTGKCQNIKMQSNVLNKSSNNENRMVKSRKRSSSQFQGGVDEKEQEVKRRKFDDPSTLFVPLEFQKHLKRKKNFQEHEDVMNDEHEHNENGNHRVKSKKMKIKAKNVKEVSTSSTNEAQLKQETHLPKITSTLFYHKKKSKDESLSLRERMLQQLRSSRFRYINEQLYTSHSKEAEDMFKKDPKLFKVYHDGFKQQVEHWPVNPVEKIIKAIKRQSENLVVADFGCGDALLAKSVPNKVHSFDLVALSDEVTVCDMAHTPLENSSIDICVFCLSLMGKNLENYVMEASRVLKVGGSLKIAEVASRFDNVDIFIKDMKKYGFQMLNKDLSHELFYFMNFKKDSSIKKVKNLPTLSLKPCWYKKR